MGMVCARIGLWTCVSILLPHHSSLSHQKNPQAFHICPNEGALICKCSSVSKSYPTQCDLMNHSTPGTPVLYFSPWVCSGLCPLSQCCHPTVLSSVTCFSSCPQSFQHQGLFQWVSSSHQVAKLLDLQLQHQSFQWISMIDLFGDWLVWFPCSPRDSQESSPAPQFRRINSLALSHFYGPTITFIHDY